MYIHDIVGKRVGERGREGKREWGREVHVYIHVHVRKERVGVGERELWVEREGVCVREGGKGRECV